MTKNRFFKGSRSEASHPARIALVVCFLAGSFYAKAQVDTFLFKWEAKAGISMPVNVVCNPRESFIVYWGDGTDTTYKAPEPDLSPDQPEISNFLRKTYSDSGTYTVTVVGIGNCKLTRLNYINYVDVIYIDVSKSKSAYDVLCMDTKVRHLIASKTNNTKLGGVSAKYCQMSLTACDTIDRAVFVGAFTVPQFLEARYIKKGSTVDFSSELYFTKHNVTKRTNFEVKTKDNTCPTDKYIRGYCVLADTVDYTEKDGVFTFHKIGYYMIKMTNENVRGGNTTNPKDIAEVYQEIILPPSTEADLSILEVETEVSKKVLTPVFDSETFEYVVNVTYAESYAIISAITSDDWADVSGIGMHLLRVGKNTFPVTVTSDDGTTKKKNTYTIVINRAGNTNIKETETEDGKALQIYPNPTDGKIHIINYKSGNIELYDALGKLQKSESKIEKGEILIDISYLAKGMYFLKVDGKMFKVVKE